MMTTMAESSARGGGEVEEAGGESGAWIGNLTRFGSGRRTIPGWQT